MVHKKSRTAKVIAGFVGFATAVTMSFGTASAASTADLQAQIASMLASVQALQAQLAAQGGTTVAAPTTGYTFTMNLKLGSKGTDVMNLQKVLNSNAATQVAKTGAGSPGMETTTFGPATKAAVIKFQELNAAQILTPLGLTKGTGFVGVSMRAFLNSMASATTPGTTTTTTPGTTTTGGTTTTPPPAPVGTGPLSVMLSSDTPASGTVVAGQSTADLAHFTFSGSGTLNTVTLQRIGISTNTVLNNVYLYNGNVRVADGAAVNTLGVINFTGLNIPVSGTLNLSVRADIATGVSGQMVGVQLTGYTTVGQTTPSVVSLSGNLMSTASATLAGVTVAANTVNAANVNAGTVAYSFWSSSLGVSQRAVLLKTASFKLIGSASTDAIANWQLYVNGSPIAKGTVSALGYVVFDTSAAPVTLNTGSSVLEVRGDIIKGSNRTVQLSLQNAADLIMTDTQLGVNVAASGITSGSNFAVNAAGIISINPGSITTTIDPAFGSLTNVTGGATNASIGKFQLHAYGEDVKVTSISVTPAITGATGGNGTSLNNVALYYNGGQVGSSQNWSTSNAAPLTFQLGSSMIVAAGVNTGTFEVRADMIDSANATYTGGTVTVTLNAGTSNGQGMSSLNTTAVPAASISTTGLTITSAANALSIAKDASYLNQTVNSNTSNVKIGSFTIQNQNTSESMRITNLAVTLGLAAPTYTSGTLTSGSQAITVSDTKGFSVGNVISIPAATSAAIGTVTAIATPGVGGVLTVNITTAAVGAGTAGGAIVGSGSTTGPAAITNFSNLVTSETSGSGSTPINPSTGTNNFSVNFTLAPGQVKTIGIFAAVGTANFGSVTTTLLPTAYGVTSNITATPGSATTGQVITLSSGSLANPTLNPSPLSMAQQFVVGGSQNVGVANFNFVATNGVANITELKFTVASPSTAVTSVSVGGVSAPVGANGVAYLTGLNLSVPNTNAGLNVPVLMSFAPVGVNGITSNATASTSLTYMKYIIGGQTTVNTTVYVASNNMVVVGTKPTITLTQSTAPLTNGLVEIADVTVAADAGGDLKLAHLPISITSTNGVTIATSTTAFIVKDSNNNNIPVGQLISSVVGSGGTQSATNSFGLYSGATATTTIDFTVGAVAGTGYRIGAGTSQTFKIFATAATVSGAVNTVSLSTQVGTAPNFTWDDLVGGVQGITAGNTYNYPTNTSVIHN